MNQSIYEERVKEWMANAMYHAIDILGKGVNTLFMGHNILHNFQTAIEGLAIILKSLLVFEAGRKAGWEATKNVATAPTEGVLQLGKMYARSALRTSLDNTTRTIERLPGTLQAANNQGKTIYRDSLRALSQLQVTKSEAWESAMHREQCEQVI